MFGPHCNKLGLTY